MSTPERTIVITGASSGFGAAAVRAFADRGDRVWGTMRDTAGRNAAKKAELEATPPHHHRRDGRHQRRLGGRRLSPHPRPMAPSTS
jgi:NAD(P)-dependent dehydrogenase (short-subunit alcohol dehydrogenase family)